MDAVSSIESLIKYVGSMNALTFLGIAFLFMLWQGWRFFTNTLYPEWVPWCKSQVEDFLRGWNLLVGRAASIDACVQGSSAGIDEIKAKLFGDSDDTKAKIDEIHGVVTEISKDQKKILNRFEQQST